MPALPKWVNDDGYGGEEGPCDSDSNPSCQTSNIVDVMGEKEREGYDDDEDDELVYKSELNSHWSERSKDIPMRWRTKMRI